MERKIIILISICAIVVAGGLVATYILVNDGVDNIPWINLSGKETNTTNSSNISVNITENITNEQQYPETQYVEKKVMSADSEWYQDTRPHGAMYDKESGLNGRGEPVDEKYLDESWHRHDTQDGKYFYYYRDE